MMNSMLTMFPDPNHGPDFGANLGQTIDANGNVTNYNYAKPTDPTGAVLLSVTNTRGHGTFYGYNNLAAIAGGGTYLNTISQLGPGGTLQTATLNWGARTAYNPTTDFPSTCSTSTYHTCPSTWQTPLNSITMPDGRSYQFLYGNWGNLTQVTNPDGAITQYTYGNSTTTSFLPPGWAASQSPGNAPGSPVSTELLQRRVTQITTYQNGLSSPPLIDTIGHNTTTNPGGFCVSIQWITDTLNDAAGTVRKKGICVGDNAAQITTIPPIATPTGTQIAEEIWQGATLLSGTYSGNISTGALYSIYDTMGSKDDTTLAFYADFRPTQTKHVKDGLTWWELFNYECMSATAGNRPADSGGCGTFRTWGNITSKQIALDNGSGAPGTVLATTTTNYLHNSSTYDPRNIIRLPSLAQVADGSGNVLTKKTFSYDDYGLQASSEPGLDTTYTNAYRGNPTTTNAYTSISGGTYLSTHGYFFDNGSVYKTQDPKGNYTSTITSYDFGKCYQQAAPQVQFSVGGGTGATATCSAAGGAVSSCSVTAGGSGYTSPPAVALIGGAGSSAAVTATLSGTPVAGVSCAAGYADDACLGNWTSIPTLAFVSNGSGSGAAASVTSMELSSVACLGGTYTSSPTCTVSGGGGSGATCSCYNYGYGASNKWACYGGETYPTYGTGGSGYTSLPTVTISGGGGSGMTCSSEYITVKSINLSGGSGYTTAAYFAGQRKYVW